MNLTPRQSEILRAIIEEYIDNAQPVASIELVEKRALTVSGATVRNIMSDLVKKGYLQMLHVSSGRSPTERAYRYYISELMVEVPVSVLDELAIKQKVWNSRYELERLLKSATTALSETTGNLAFALTGDGYITYCGTCQLLDNPEFFEIDVAKAVFKFVEDYDLAHSVLTNVNHDGEILVLIGREIGLANMEEVTIITTRTMVGSHECILGVIGPSRMKYDRIIPIIKHSAQLVKEMGESL